MPIRIGQGGGNENLATVHVNLGGGAGAAASKATIVWECGPTFLGGRAVVAQPNRHRRSHAMIGLVAMALVRHDPTSQTPGSGVWFAATPR